MDRPDEFDVDLWARVADDVMRQWAIRVDDEMMHGSTKLQVERLLKEVLGDGRDVR